MAFINTDKENQLYFNYDELEAMTSKEYADEIKWHVDYYTKQQKELNFKIVDDNNYLIIFLRIDLCTRLFRFYKIDKYITKDTIYDSEIVFIQKEFL